MSEIMESLKRDLAEVNWRDLRIHLQRDAVIVVSSELDLIAVAQAVAVDDKDRVGEWIVAGQLGKPAEPQLKCWEAELDKAFRLLIVQPFILIQEVAHA